MKSLCVLAALAMVVLPVTVQAADFSDKNAWICDRASIEPELSDMIENSTPGELGIKLLYVKDEITETARSKTELRCRVVAVMNNGSVSGIFRFTNRDGHELIGFEPGQVR